MLSLLIKNEKYSSQKKKKCIRKCSIKILNVSITILYTSKDILNPELLKENNLTSKWKILKIIVHFLVINFFLYFYLGLKKN